MGKQSRRPNRAARPTSAASRQPNAARRGNPLASRLGLLVAAVAAVLIVAAGVAAMGRQDEADASLPPVAGGAVTCDPIEHVTYHVHPHLTIRHDGSSQPIPANIGIFPNCLYWLHTHSSDGILHVEAPSPREFTLGQFFDVWARPLSQTQVGDRVAAEGERVFAFVDGAPWEGDPRAIPLLDRSRIELQVGTEALAPLTGG